MSKINWAELLEPVNSGEYEAKEYLRARGFKVKDVSDNPAYWGKDIDLLLCQDSRTTSIEIKWDNCISRTLNLYIETENPRSKDGKGWFYFCEADYLFYGDSVNKLFYIFNRKELFSFIEEHKKGLNRRCTYDGSKGYLVPLSEVKDLVKVIEL